MARPFPIIGVRIAFRCAFTRPTWTHARTLVVGTLLARGRRTVAAAGRATAQAADKNGRKVPAVLSRARGPSPTRSRRWLGRRVAAFAPTGGVTVAIAETLE